jgi:hypothetical protein
MTGHAALNAMAFFDLTEDENGENANGSAPSEPVTLAAQSRSSMRKRHVSTSTRSTRPAASKKVKSEPTGGQENTRENAGAAASENAANDNRKPAAVTTTTTATQGDDDDDDVQVVEAPRTIPTAASLAAATDTDTSTNNDEIQVVGTVNQMLLPHMRQHCTSHSFLQNNDPRRLTNKEMKKLSNHNMKVCSLCYCYACDVVASECPKWRVHCLATDRGPMAATWKRFRDQAKEAKKRTTSALATAASSSNAPVRSVLPVNRGEGNAALAGRGPLASGILATAASSSNAPVRSVLPANRGQGNAALAGRGPFAPETPGASQHTELTKCRKCGWFNKFVHKNFLFDRRVASGLRVGRSNKPSWYTDERIDEIHPTGFLDWCHACGCVASERDLRKVQSNAYVPSEYSICLGTKDIEFRLKAHDPREMEDFREKWEEQEWTYDGSEMEQELFDHRLGELPLLEMIVASMPITTEDKIPTDGKRTSTFLQGDNTKASAFETEAVLIDDDSEGLILKELSKASPEFGTAHTWYIDGDITAVWDSDTRQGVSYVLASQRKLVYNKPLVSPSLSDCCCFSTEIYAPCLCKYERSWLDALFNTVSWRVVQGLSLST